MGFCGYIDVYSRQIYERVCEQETDGECVFVCVYGCACAWEGEREKERKIKCASACSREIGGERERETRAKNGSTTKQI